MRKLFLILLFLTACSFADVYDSDTEINVYFCPQDMCVEKILDLIEQSDDIKCAFYDLDLPELIEKLKEKNAEVIIEDSNSIEGFIEINETIKIYPKFSLTNKKGIVQLKKHLNIIDSFSWNN